MFDEAKTIVEEEIRALRILQKSFGNDFKKIVNLILRCRGKIVLTGVGKSGNICSKISATMSSLGVGSFFLHPHDALHGGLGSICKNDIVVFISLSGESGELLKILSFSKERKIPTISITANPDSSLAKLADCAQIIPIKKEAGFLGCAPTSSTTTFMVFGDVLALTIARVKKISKKQFSAFHPEGTLGKKLLTKVSEIMTKGKNNSIIHITDSLKKCLLELSQKKLGLVSVVDSNHNLCGVVTDGDIRRAINKNNGNIRGLSIKSIMNSHPVAINASATIDLAISVFQKHNFSCAPVVDKKKPIGIISIKLLSLMGFHI